MHDSNYATGFQGVEWWVPNTVKLIDGKLEGAEVVPRYCFFEDGETVFLDFADEAEDDDDSVEDEP